jgi:hypothetical protein
MNCSVENLRSAQLAASKFLGIIIKELRSRMEQQKIYDFLSRAHFIRRQPLVTLSMSHSIEF